MVIGNPRKAWLGMLDHQCLKRFENNTFHHSMYQVKGMDCYHECNNR